MRGSFSNKRSVGRYIVYFCETEATQKHFKVWTNYDWTNIFGRFAIFKTRTLATNAIDEGKVKWNNANIKPSRTVAIGDRYRIKTPARLWTIEVTGLLHNRVEYAEAIKNYLDITSEEDKQLNQHVGYQLLYGKEAK